MYEVFDHNPDVWTAAQLRKAIAHIPDDAPIRIGIPPAPGELEGCHLYVLIGADQVVSVWPATSTSPEHSEVEEGITLFGDYPKGQYDRPERL